jgi:PAS domain S-box-containing protein
MPRAGLLFALLEQSHDMLAVTDADGRVVWSNARFRDATGLEPESNGTLASLVAPGPELEATRKAINRALLGGALVNAEIELRGVGGTQLHLLANASCELGQVAWALRDNAATAPTRHRSASGVTT